MSLTAAAKRWRSDVEVAFRPWLVARVLVVATYLAIRAAVRAGIIHSRGADLRIHQGLLAWDGAFYADVARHGYKAMASEALRFFPLLPLLGRAVGVVLGGNGGLGVIAVANLAALAAGAVLHRLALSTTGDRKLAARTTWLLALAPPAFVLVLGYSEGLAIALSAGAVLAARGRRWLWAAGLGALAGLCRPLGALLVIPLLIEAAPGFWSARDADRLQRLAAIAGPGAGVGAYLAWSEVANGDAWAPLRAQQDVRLRGGFVDPITSLFHQIAELADGHLSNGLHVPWALLLVGLLLVAVRRLPLSMAAYAAVALFVALCSRNLDSLERYALGTFPFVLAAACVTESRRVERLVRYASSAALIGYTALAFLNRSVP